MKLTYRGVAYEYNPIPIEVTPDEIGGKYRGINWRRYYPKFVPISQAFAQLKYRSVAYCIGDRQEIQHKEVVSSQKPCVQITQEVNKRFKSRDELTKIHLSNIRKNLENRLQLAKQRGDTNLVCLLEDEARQMKFS